MSRQTSVALLACATLWVALAGCTSADPDGADAEPAPTASTSAPATPEPSATTSTEAPLDLTPADGLATTFDASREVVFPEEQVVDAATPEGLVLTLTGDLLRARSLPGLESAYEIPPVSGAFVDLWLDEDNGRGYALSMTSEPGGGTAVGSDAYAVVRFDLATGAESAAAGGTIRQQATGSSQPASGQIAQVLGDVVMVTGFAPGTDEPTSAVALDLGSGDLAWHRSGASALAAAAGTVVLGTGRAEAPGEVRGVDPEKGTVRWRTAQSSTAAAILGVRGSVATLAATYPSFGVSTVTRVSLRSGKQVRGPARQVDTAFYTCHESAEPDVVVCSVNGGTVVGWDVTRNKEVWSLPTATRFAPTVTAVRGGLVYGHLDDGTGVVLDASNGDDIVPDSGASPVDVNEYGGLTLYLGLAVFTPQGTPAP